MNWTKVTPDKMPPDMEMVMVTLSYNGESHFEERARWNGSKGYWERLRIIGRNEWERFWSGEVTHWIPYGPAED